MSVLAPDKSRERVLEEGDDAVVLGLAREEVHMLRHQLAEAIELLERLQDFVHAVDVFVGIHGAVDLLVLAHDGGFGDVLPAAWPRER